MDAPRVVSHEKYVGSTNADGYPDAPTYQDAVLRAVFGWQPLASDVPLDADLTRRVVRSLLVMVPDVGPYSTLDRVTVGGQAYLITEDVRDYNTGPFGYQPGGAIVVEKVSG